jgi:hypothetical protein
MTARSALGCVKTQKIEITPLYIALLNRIIKKITLYIEATMTFDTGWHVNPLAGTEVSAPTPPTPIKSGGIAAYVKSNMNAKRSCQLI